MASARNEARGAEGVEEGYPSPQGEELGERAMLSPESF